MDKRSLLDCTLRDGGYITGWQFGEETIKALIQGLIDCGIDYVECGYLNSRPYEQGSAIFNNIEQIGEFIPSDRGQTMVLAMADVEQFHPDDLMPISGKSIDGIRVVFYKRQIEEALDMCKAVADMGYKLFVQPMVTIDYSLDEYAKLVRKIAKLNPYGVSIVDSFGYMDVGDVRRYFRVLDNLLSRDAVIGYHSHNNMQLAFPTAQEVFAYETGRSVIVDASLYGIGRGAGNLNTEIIAEYYNRKFGSKYHIFRLLDLIGDYIIPIHEQRSWGYSPYLFITGLYHVHPNFACYLLENHRISVSEFERFVQIIPEEMRTKCRRPYVEDLYQKFRSDAIG